MHPKTVATLDGLRDVEWFAKAGTPGTQAADVLSTWEEAVASCSSPEWRDLCIEAPNAFRNQLLKASPAEFKRWNTVAAEVRPVARALVTETRVVHFFDLPKAFVGALNWDITHLCLESEFADVAPPGFYVGQGYWYMNGHFPCGWRGPLNTSGRPVILYARCDALKHRLFEIVHADPNTTAGLNAPSVILALGNRFGGL